MDDGSQGGLFGETGATSAESAPPGDARLVASYVEVGRTLDDLPYTDDFERLCSLAGIDDSGAARRAALHRLLNLRKASKLPKVGKAQSSRVSLEPEEADLLGSMVVEAAGSMGQRDNLPYSSEFDALVDRFNQRIGRSLTAHDVWRVVAKLAK